MVVAGIDGALAKQYNGISCCPIFDGTVAKVNEAVDAGVPVIAWVADSAEKSKRNVGMGMLAYDAGKKAGNFIVKQLGGKGKIGVITGYLGAAQHDQRMNGALDLLKKEHPGHRHRRPVRVQGRRRRRLRRRRPTSMTSNPDLTIIYVTAGGSEASAKAVRDAKATGTCRRRRLRRPPEKQQYKDGGEILALIDQAPSRQTFDSLVMLHNILAFGEKYPSEIAIDAPMALGKGAKG